MSKKKKIFYFFLAILLIVVAFQWQMIWYGLAQARGQLSIVWNVRSVEEIINDQQVPDSIKQKLMFIREVKKYAVDSLGIAPTDNYTTFFDQKGKDILWVVTACKPFAMESKEWGFPFLGSFSYKGFFVYEMALAEEKIWKEKGYDVSIRTTDGWSTLGWFKDPVLSNMLDRSEGELAELIVHELTHGTLFVKDSVQFNENLATFIGQKGAIRFLINKYGKSSVEYVSYKETKHDKKKFAEHILRGANRLDSLYIAFNDHMSYEAKYSQKQQMIKKIFSTIDTLTLYQKDRYIQYYEDFDANNTYFMSYLRYREKLDIFEETYKIEFNGDLKSYLNYLKKKFPSL